MVVSALFNGAIMPRLPYIMPWHLVGSVLVVIGTALMCKSHPYLSSSADSSNTKTRHRESQHIQRQNIWLYHSRGNWIWMLRRSWISHCSISSPVEGYSKRCRSNGNM